MSVARVRALAGLKDALPRSFTQISWRMCVVMGQRKPEATSPSAICRQRSERVPFGSSIEMRLPPICGMTQGTELQNVNERIGDFRVIWFWPFLSSREKGALFWQGTSGK